ncbi:MAG: carbohydrate ABC transporter permease [Christensenellaceae bacterium]|nr:carbohydrate ABC transporter permease [Christensenellaceae bacterium]
MNKAKKVNLVRGIVCRTVLVIFLAFTLLPAWVMIVNSFKTPNQLLDGVLWFAFPLNFGNYAEAFNKIAPYIWNSVSISVVSTVGITLIAALTGYAFGHFEFKGKNILFAFIMVNMMIPSVLTLVPSYLVVVTLGLYDTQFAVLLPYLGGGAVMGIYLVRGFVEQLPKAVFEAAKIDGASEFKTFVFIAMPLLGTILTTVSILALLNAWNDIVWPMLVLDSDRLKTIPLGLIQFNQQQGANKGAMFAGYILTSLPLLSYFVLNLKSFMDSLTEGAVK